MSIPPIRERVDKVRAMRLASQDAAVRKLAARPHQFREMNETYSQSLVIPAVSSENYLYIPMGFVARNTIVTNLVSVIYDCEEWVFGVVTSKMHKVWAKAFCGKHEERPRYSLKLGYNTFPFPRVSEVQKDILTQCARRIIMSRARFPNMTLAQLYKKMPRELSYAHSLLDAVVDGFYQTAQFVSDQERLDCLFELYTILGG
jgi:hypothetical protein